MDGSDMTAPLSKAAWIDRAASRLSRLDPSASIEDLLAISTAAFDDGQSSLPESWSDGYFLNRPSSLSSWWQREFWARLLELEPRLSPGDLWDLADQVWGLSPTKVLTPRAMAEHILGTGLPPMNFSDIETATPISDG